jgi:Ni/Fe-hydrogenase subunit HybB-like protein
MIYSEFSFPNDLYIFWSLMIVTYPFITGMVAGTFFVSMMRRLFGVEELAPVDRFSLLVCYAFLLCATLPLLNHLGHPERALNIFVIPNFRSAIGGFGFIYLTFLVALTMILWFSYRREMIGYRSSATGIARRLWSMILLGVYDDDAQTRAVDERMVRLLTMIAAPSVTVLSGYVGFLFGSLKSNPWWSTPLMPFVFLVSGVISGLALTLLLYLILGAVGILERSYPALRKLAAYLWWSTLLYVVFEGIELLYFFYESSDAWFVISTLLLTKLNVSFFALQLGVGLGIGFTLLTFIFAVRVAEPTFARMAAVAGVFMLFEVWMMRWNIVVGGQLFSKSYVGFRHYFPHWFDREGIVAALLLTLLPLGVLWLFSKLVSFTRPAPDGEGA